MKNLSAYRLLIAGAIAALLVAAPVVGGRAQEPRRLAQPESVPLDLVTALVSVGGLGGDPQILVGSLPGWITRAGRATSVNAAIIGRTWSRVDSTGAPVELSLTVATSPRDSACPELNLQVRTMRKP